MNNKSINEKISDFIMAYKLLKELGRGWDEYEAYELGLIDNKGSKLKSPTTPEEKEAYSSYYKIIFNLKRLLQKVVGKNKYAHKIVSMFLLKENVSKRTINIITESLDIKDFSNSSDEITESVLSNYLKTIIEHK